VFVPGKSPVQAQSEILDILIFRKLKIVYAEWRGGGRIPLRVVIVTWIDLDPFAFNLNVNQFCIEAGLVCSFCESMAESLSVASTAVSEAKFAVVYSGEVGRSAEYSRYVTRLS
jgi:hypothetical protein